MLNHAAAVGSFESHIQAEQAVQELQRNGVDRSMLMIISSELRKGSHVVGFYNMADRAQAWGKTGAFWGGLWGLLFSLWLFWVPGIGPLLVAIPIVLGATALGALSALAAVIYSMGIPKDSVLKYAAGEQEGRYVLIFRGTDDQINRTRQVLDHSKSLASMLNMPVPAAGV